MNRIKFQPITSTQEKIIFEFLTHNFGSSTLKAFENMILYVKIGKVKEVFALPKTAKTVIDNIKHANAAIYSAGVPIGSLINNKFQIEIEGSKIILPFTSKKIQIKTDQFLYGKPIFVENVKKIYGQFKKDDTVIILGKNKLHYGVGVALYSSNEFDELKPNTMVIRGSKNKPFDRGWYLRKGG